MDSQFVPKSFDKNKGVCLIAGKGHYPILTHQALIKNNVPVKLIGFEDETEQELISQFDKDNHIIIKVGQLGKMLKYLKKFQVGYAIMAGQITPKRLFKGLHPDLKAALLLAKLKRRNAETIFGTIAEEIQKINIDLLDARAFMDEHIAQEGILCGKFKTNEAFLQHGLDIVKEVARLDIGQSIVVRKGTVLAVEGFEGTDAMIKRAGEFNAKEAIFLKASKPKQDFRFDVPVFGERTLKNLAEANIQYAAIEAHKSLILNKEHTLKLASKLGISIFGF